MITSSNTITVTYERKFSDGNYGAEGLSLSVTIADRVTDEEALDVAHRVRRTVLSFLAASAASRVASAARFELNPPPPLDRQPVAAGSATSDLQEAPF